MVPLAIGSQTGGSTIRPAAFCGVIGFKPTWGLVSCDGMKPFAPSLDTVGFIGDSIELMSRVLMSTAPLRKSDDALDEHLDPAVPLHIGVYRTRYIAEASVDVLAALDRVAVRLAEAGHVVTEVEDPFSDFDINALQDVVMWGEAIEAMAPELQSSYDRLSEAVVSALEAHRHISRAEIAAAKADLADLRLLCDKAMNGLDAWLTPAVPGVAPLMEEGNGVATFNRLFTALHVPCLTLPAGLGANELPLGLQLVAPRGEDLRLIRVAQAVQQLISE
jgi:Asp-tRNA(Asn)/Glu-tRNA(Gln) amidotransferase A subunit family amidase